MDNVLPGLRDVTNSGQQQSIHHEFIRESMPEWITGSTLARVIELKQNTHALPDWIKSASVKEHRAARFAAAAGWHSQSGVDRLFETLQDVRSFAQPLLRRALKTQYGVDVDVRKVSLKLYSPAHLSPWAANIVKGVSVRTVSLLDAALHNFSADEIFTADSSFVSEPDAFGHYEVKRMGITVDQFEALCRKLDLGAKYRDYLEDYLQPDNGLAQGVLQHNVTRSQQDALKAAAHMALMKKDISADAYLVALGLFNGSTRLKLDGEPIKYYHLKMLDVCLKGIVLIAADLDVTTQGVRRVIAYVPHDPEHPLKEYASAAAFMLELTRQLRDNGQASMPGKKSYQVFFSRFVAHAQRGRFFARLNAQLVTVTYHGFDPSTHLPAWRETPVAEPRLQFDVMAFEDDIEHRFRGDVWAYLYEVQLNKILEDGRALAISTAAADSAERWAWVENVEKILSDVFNAALMIVSPFVPVLGEVVMAYMTYQLLSELVEGVVELAEGMYLDAAEHLIGFAESLIQLGIFAVGGGIGKEVVLPKLSSFIEGSKPVTLRNGEKRLWGQDLQPYLQRNLRLASDSKPDVDGLHRHEGKSILRLDGDHFELEKDSATGKPRVRHPSRAEAYQPAVDSNGAGAFIIEGEKPHTWDADTLMRRLGASVDGLSNDFSGIRTVSRTDMSALLRMYANNERALPLLSDTVARFRIDRDIRAFIEDIASTDQQTYLHADPMMQVQLLADAWPGQAIEVLDAEARVLARLGDTSPNPVQVSLDSLLDNDLLKTLLSHLDQAQTRVLLSDEFGAPVAAPDVNASRLRAELAKLAEQRKQLIFEARYRNLEHSISAEARLIQGQVDDLPGVIAQALVAHATPSDLHALKAGRVPERLANLGRWALQDVRVSRAYEGFYLTAVNNPDFDALALHSLINLPGWNADTRIDVHLYRYGGQPLDSLGPEGATLQRTIVAGENGVYQACDEAGNALHSGSDLFTAILQALPDAQRNALSIHIGQGPVLKAALRDHALKPYRLLGVLADLPVLEMTTYDPSVMRLRGGAPTEGGELAQLQVVANANVELVEAAFHKSIDELDRFNYLRGLKWIDEHQPLNATASLWEAFRTANADSYEANQRVVQSVEVLPDLQKLLLPDSFNALLARMFTQEGLMPLTEAERNLGAAARNLEQTGRIAEYLALQRAVREGSAPISEALIQLHEYGGPLSSDVTTIRASSEVTPTVMANLQLAQRTVLRTKELLPLSGNQLASIWQYGGSAIAKIKGLRQMDLQEGGFTARLTTAEMARKAIDIKGGNCSENSRVTFSILASQPRTSRVHIVKATAFDHQYVVIGDDLNNLSELVVADSWPEFPAAHTADKGYFSFEMPALETLEPGPAVAQYAFINDARPGQAELPPVSTDNTIRQIKINKLYQRGAYAQFTSLKALGSQYNVPGEVPVSFERLPYSTVDQRVSAYESYRETFSGLLNADTA
ncbi:hypothetical protein GIW70_09430 [Pseudomonas syringae]|nr:hypothetical protein [Pseudomonas syringae]MCF5068417.1 hypothetical protein [Pseudomonas syringae]